jgi:glycosyl transferase family 87
VAARRSTALAIALALLWLALGYANIARGARHAGAGYRFWAFQHHCYSDVIAMHGDRYLGGGRPRPYLDDRIEYPVLLGLALWLPSFVPGGALAHFTATYLFLAACLFAALLALARTPRASPWWLGATPALVYYAGLNWDLLPIALLALAIRAGDAGRAGASGALAGLGVAAKLFPAAYVPPAAAALALARRGALARFLGGVAATLLAVNVPVALAAPDAWSWFFRYNSGRGAENSIWEALRVGPGPALEILSFAPLAVAVLFGAVASARAARRGDAGAAVRLATALALVAWIASNKVWSPQYALYGFFAGALASAPRWLFVALTAMSAADYHLAFELRARSWDPWFRDVLVEPGHVLRTLLWLALAAWIARELWRRVSTPSTR